MYQPINVFIKSSYYRCIIFDYGVLRQNEHSLRTAECMCALAKW